MRWLPSEHWKFITDHGHSLPYYAFCTLDIRLLTRTPPAPNLPSPLHSHWLLISKAILLWQVLLVQRLIAVTLFCCGPGIVGLNKDNNLADADPSHPPLSLLSRSLVVGTVEKPSSKSGANRNKRCLLHSLESQKMIHTGSWLDVWLQLAPECQTEVCYCSLLCVCILHFSL